MKTIASIVLLLALACVTARAAELTLEFAWQQDRAPAVDGWRLYWTNEPGAYDRERSIEIPRAGEDTEFTASETITASGLTYFVLAAYNEAGESDRSNEVQHLFPPSAPYKLTVRIRVE